MAVTRAAARAKVQEEVAGKGEQNNGEAQKDSSTMSGKLPKTLAESKLLNEGKELDTHLRTRTAVLLLVLIFASSLAALGFVYLSFPHLEK